MNRKYTYSEATAGLTIVILVIVLSGYFIGALLEVQFPFLQRTPDFVIFPACYNFVENHFSI